MKILFGITALGLGGAEVVTVDLANRMSARGHEVTILSLGDRNEMGPRLSETVQVILLGMKNSPISFLKGQRDAAKIIRQINPDVVHANMVHANIFFRLLRLHTPIRRLICSAHNTNEGGYIRMIMYRITDYLSNLNTNVSNEAVEKFRNLHAFQSSNSYCVYNGIDTNRFSSIAVPKKNNAFRFVIVGRLTLQKDHKNLFQAIKLLADKELNFHCTVVGDGELRGALEVMVRTLNITSFITFAGKTDDPLPYYQEADGFVLSSAFEGFGIVLAEAMACELPVITTDAGGCAEVVGDSRWVVPVQSPESLAEKMEELMSCSWEERQLLGKRNRDRAVTLFDISKITDQWLQLYTCNESSSGR